VDPLLLAPLPATEASPVTANDPTHLLDAAHPLLVDTEMSVEDTIAHLLATAADMIVDTTVDMTDQIADTIGTIAVTTAAMTATIVAMADTATTTADKLAPALLQDARGPSTGRVYLKRVWLCFIFVPRY